jgi:hypothetical protein
MPAPIVRDGGIETGSFPVIAVFPSSAAAAARCDNGSPPQASIYAGTSGNELNKYGLPNEIATTGLPVAASVDMNEENPLLVLMLPLNSRGDT